MGRHAPGLASEAAAVAVSHHLLLSHGLAVPAIRAAAPDARVGIVLDLWQTYPASDSPEDTAAALQVDGEHNRWFLDPLFRGEYPQDLPERNEIVAPLIHDGDLETIAVPIDFLGVNNYSRAIVAAGPGGAALRPERGGAVHGDGVGSLPLTGSAPSSSVWPTTTAHAGLYVTENGASYSVGPGADGRVHDEARVRFLRDHLLAARLAIDAGVPLSGYFVWSLLDNFEWDRGYTQRFGVVWVDYETQTRIPKDSFYWYRDHIARSRATRGPSPATPVTAG